MKALKQGEKLRKKKQGRQGGDAKNEHDENAVVKGGLTEGRGEEKIDHSARHKAITKA